MSEDTSTRAKLNEGIKAAQAKMDAWVEEQAQRLTVDDADLNGEFKTHATNFLVAATKRNKATWVTAQTKAERDNTRATKAVEFRGTGEKLTKDMMDEKLTLDPAVQTVERKLAFAEYQEEQYTSVQRAWEHKRDCLVQMGSTARAEFSAGLSMNETPAKGPHAATSTGTKTAPVDDLEDEPVTRAKPAPATKATSAKPTTTATTTPKAAPVAAAPVKKTATPAATTNGAAKAKPAAVKAAPPPQAEEEEEAPEAEEDEELDLGEEFEDAPEEEVEEEDVEPAPRKAAKPATTTTPQRAAATRAPAKAAKPRVVRDEDEELDA